MGLFNWIKNQLIDVIEWIDSSNNTLVWRFPDQDHEIKNGAKLTVREGQVAIFVSEGQIADIFKPGLYTLETQNLPILTSLKSWKYGFNSPFKCEVYYVNTRQYPDMRWGTMNPIMMRDADFGAVRLRAFGIYAIQVSDPGRFFKEIVGTDGHYTTQEIEGALKRNLVSSFTTALGQAKIPALDLAGNYDQIATIIQDKMQSQFAEYGLALRKFVIENISLPPEVEKALDQRSTMGVLGDMGRYTQFQAANAIRDAAQNPSGMSGAGMGMGAGFAMGQVMTHTIAGAMAPQPQAQQAAPVAQAPTVVMACSGCGAHITAGAKFCPECGARQGAGCPGCGAQLKPGSRFCGECGTKIG